MARTRVALSVLFASVAAVNADCVRDDHPWNVNPFSNVPEGYNAALYPSILGAGTCKTRGLACHTPRPPIDGGSTNAVSHPHAGSPSHAHSSCAHTLEARGGGASMRRRQWYCPSTGHGRHSRELEGTTVLGFLSDVPRVCVCCCPPPPSRSRMRVLQCYWALFC